MSESEATQEANAADRVDAAAACLEQLQRERADFLNYKHRVDRERADDRERTRDETVRHLLPAIDDLDRALAHVPDELRGHPWAEGVSLAHQRLLDALRQLGVERVGSEGERFDPSVHEAVVYHTDPNAAEQHVMSVVRPGYRLGSRLVRPAQVVVAGPGSNEGRHNGGQSHRN
jgi:molecular chaperone GrpE